MLKIECYQGDSMKYVKTIVTLGLLYVTLGCQVGTPSPLQTGSWWYGEIDSDHIGFDVVFPWATRTYNPEFKGAPDGNSNKQ